jgi:hypothetical protein
VSGNVRTPALVSVPGPRETRPMTPARQDWTVPVDDGLVDRLGTCTACGGGQGLYGRWEIWLGTTRALAIVVCDRCLRTDPQRLRLTARLEARYGSEP